MTVAYRTRRYRDGRWCAYVMQDAHYLGGFGDTEATAICELRAALRVEIARLDVWISRLRLATVEIARSA